MDDNIKATIAMIVTPVVILLVVLINKVDSKKCDPVRERTSAGMARLYSKSSIEQVVLRNGHEPLDRSFDSLVIRDTQTLEIIRNLILERGFINLNKYSPDWEVDIIITVVTGTEFTIGLKRSTTEGETDSEYKIYFNEECDGNYRYGSSALGHKIVELIQNR